MSGVQGGTLSVGQPMGENDVRGMREEAMTLQERIAWCLDMARAAPSWEVERMHVHELIGLRGLEWSGSTNAEWHAYTRGLADRATLLKLEE